MVGARTFSATLKVSSCSYLPSKVTFSHFYETETKPVKNAARRKTDAQAKRDADLSLIRDDCEILCFNTRQAGSWMR